MARSRDLKVVISGDAKGLGRAFASAERGAATLEARVGKSAATVGHHLSTIAKIGTAALGVGLLGAVKGSIDAFAEAQQVATQTNAVLKSTGQVAGVSAKQVSDLATAISKKSGIDDEAVQASENLLLTFTKIRNETGKGNDVFNQATKAVSDLATSMNHGAVPSVDQLHRASLQVGKALNDPIKGITALQRVGVSFTKQQKDQITALVSSGHTMEAQKRILKELRTEFGGSAAAAGDTFAGKIAKAKVAVGNLGEAIGGALAPVIGDAAGKLADFVNSLASSDRPARFFGRIKDAAGDAKDAIGHVIDRFKDLKGDKGSVGAAIGALLVEGFQKVPWDKIGSTLGKGVKGALHIGGDVAHGVKQALSEVFDHIDEKALGRKFAGVMVGALAALTDPGFWLSHWREVIGIAIAAFPVARMGGLAGRVAEAITKPLVSAGTKVGPVLGRVFGDAATKASNALFTRLAEVAPRLATFMVHTLPNVFRRSAAFVKAAGVAGTLAMVTLARGIASGAGKAAGAAGSAATALGRAIARGLQSAFDGVVGYFTSRVNDIIGILNTAIDAYNKIPLAPNIPKVPTIHSPDRRPSTGAVKVAPHQAGGLIGGQGRGDIVPAMLEPGEFVIRRRVVEQFGPTFFARINQGATSSGPGYQHGGPVARAAGGALGFAQLEALWIRAGGDPKMARLMAHVAQAESGGNPSAHNPSGASGLWQILGAPFGGNVFDPLTNARMAVAKLNSQGLGAWAASRGAWGHYAGERGMPPTVSATDVHAVTRRSAPSADDYARHARHAIAPIMRAFGRGSGLEGRTARRAASSVEAAQHQEEIAGRIFDRSEEDLNTIPGRITRVGELTSLRMLANRRLRLQRQQIAAKKRQITLKRQQIAALAHQLRRGSRHQRPEIRRQIKKLQGDIATLKGEIHELGGQVDNTKQDVADYTHEIKTIQAGPQDQPEPLTGTAAVPGADAYLASIDKESALAELTPETGDDLAAAQKFTTAWENILAYEQTHGASDSDIAEAARNVKSGRDRVAEITDAATQATQANTDALKQLADEMKRNNDFAASVVATTGLEATRALVDFLSGQIGPRVSLRGMTPGYGVGARY